MIKAAQLSSSFYIRLANGKLPARWGPITTVRHSSTSEEQTQAVVDVRSATLDISHMVRAPDLHAANCRRRNHPAQSRFPDRIVKLHAEDQALEAEATSQRAHQNRLDKRIKEILASRPKGAAVAAAQEQGNDEVDALIATRRELQPAIKESLTRQRQLRAEIYDLAIQLPNLTSPRTPPGNSPKLLRSYTPAPHLSIPHPNLSTSHVDIGTALDLLDFSASAATSGWGFYFLKNAAVLLEQALISFALRTALAHSFRLLAPPSIVHTSLASAAGFRPRDQHGERQTFALEGSHPPASLAATAEIPLAGMRARTTLPRSALPDRVVGVSRCYRAEAGARGVDARGLYRVHEFSKVELFVWLPGGDPPDASDRELDAIVALQERICQALGLKYRVLEMPGNDLGASAYRKVDLEAFFPSRGDVSDGWGEVTSASACTDYQARRLGTRVRNEGREGKAGFAHTLNGTAVAVPRVLAAILENGWDEKGGRVVLPECLWGYMGMECIERPKRGGGSTG